jgi:hypothetical protein
MRENATIRSARNVTTLVVLAALAILAAPPAEAISTSVHAEAFVRCTTQQGEAAVGCTADAAGDVKPPR